MPVDIEVGGAYLPPIAQALLLAWLIFLLLNPLLRRLGVLQRVWHEALFQGALYCAICAGLILWMGGMSR